MVVFASPLFQFRIMNQAAKIVSDALLGLDFKNVEIGGVVYTIKPPTIKVICSAIHHFSNIGMTGDNIMEAIKKLPGATDDMLKGISFDEIKEVLEICFSMMDISAFQCVSLMKNVSMLAARPKQ